MFHIHGYAEFSTECYSWHIVDTPSFAPSGTSSSRDSYAEFCAENYSLESPSYDRVAPSGTDQNRCYAELRRVVRITFVVMPSVAPSGTHDIGSYTDLRRVLRFTIVLGLSCAQLYASKS